MVRKRLIATVAVAPLLLFAGSAFAETTISNTRTTGVSTATVNNGAPDDIKVTNAGKFELTTPGAAITQNSNNNVDNAGGITTKDVDGAIGIKVDTGVAGITGNLTNSGAINHSDDYTPTDTDKDGDEDGEFAEGTGRYGIQVTGAGGMMTGNILNTGGIIVEGNDSAGISLESTASVSGSIRSFGSIAVTGDNAVGIRIAGNVLGGTTAVQRANGVFVSGAVSAKGENAIGLDVSGDIGTGANPASLVISGGVSASGYRYTTRPFTQEARDNLDADDLLQGGPAVRVSGNVTGGIQVALPFNAADFDLDGDGKPNVTDDDDDGDGQLDTADTDDDNDGVLDTDDTDYDNDGIPDGSEGVGTITVMGGAPALLIASNTETVTIGNVGTNAGGNKDFGLIVNSAVNSDGIYDNVASTAIQIGAPVDLNNDGDFTDAGEQAGYHVEMNGGVRIDGTVTARSYNNNAHGLWLRGDVDADEIYIDGAIVAIASTTSASLVNETAVEAVGIDVGADSTVPVLNIGGFVSATGSGENASAIAIRDASGTLQNINITGTIVATIVRNDDANDGDDADLDPNNETIKGRAIAIDLRANTSGVAVAVNAKPADGDDGADGIADADADGDGIDDADEPVIVGDILFGTGADSLTLTNGALLGTMSFGLGADTLTISGGAQAKGEVLNLKAINETVGNDRYTDANLDDQLTIAINDGRLTAVNTSVVRGDALTVAANGELFVTIDPDGAAGRTNTVFEVDNASFANGSTIGFELTGLIDTDIGVGSQYTIVKAGALTFGTVNTDALAENRPYFYNITATANTGLGEVYLTIARRNAAEMGLTDNQGSALDAVYQALFADNDLAGAFLGATNKKDFLRLYDQLLPDQGEGLFSALDNSTQALFRLTATRPDMTQRYGPDSVWVQEINVGVLRETGVTIGSETKAFGFIAGYESMGDDGGALGATLAYMNAEEKDDVAQIGEQTNVSLLEAGVYWRRNVGGWLFAARGAAGYGWFEGQRRFIDPATGTSAGVIREAEASWGGFTGSANAMVAYEARFGRFYIRPQVSLDYIYLSEGERAEDGDIGLGLTVDERTSSRLSAAAELAFGATFGRDNWWRPEIRVGYRQHLAGEIGDTVAYFNGGTPFTLVATEPGDGATIVGFSLKAGTPMSYVAVEGDLETSEGEDRYNLRLAGRMMF
ncbi:MAG: autotransporter protein [Caulobacter sp.]|nr:autotransporter protein [Caulobacter sp.]